MSYFGNKRQHSQRGSFQESLRAATLSIAVVVLLLFLFGQGATKRNSDAQDDPLQKDKEYREFAQMVAEVYASIKDRYVTDIDNEKLIKGAVEGMMSSLDGHSQFLDHDTLAQLEKDTGGEFSGIGIHISIRDGILTVISAIPGTPAAKEGLQPWDRIIEIEGKSTKDITLLEAVKKLTGPPGTKVNITVYREGAEEPLDFTITRAVIKIKSVYHKMLDNKIGYVRLARFSEETSDNMRKGLEEFKAKGAQSLILDLRYNTGGLLTEAVYVSELFVPKSNLIVSTQGRVPNQNRRYESREEPVLSVPMVVLVNKGSASASEIVAGALKDHGIAVILAPKGERTFGKGSVQTIEELDTTLGEDENDNPLTCAMRLTTAHYYTPSGTNIEGEGIEPDVVVEVTRGQRTELIRHGLLGEPRLFQEEKSNDKDEEKEQESEQQSDEFYLERLEKDEQKEDGDDFVDVQLQFAVDLLKSLTVLNTNREKVALSE